jgi:protein-disulfide isomerase
MLPKHHMVAIAVSTLVIGGAVVYVDLESSNTVVSTEKKDIVETVLSTTVPEKITPEREQPSVDARRSTHRLLTGAPEPQVTVVAFSDFQCPYCSDLYPALQKLVTEMGADVAWEYRHLPLVIHPEARPAALAAECVAELKGIEAFWKYATHLFVNQENLSLSVYENAAKALGITSTDLSLCMEREDIKERILEDERTAMALGIAGTPYSVIVYADGTTKTVAGALSYERLRSLVRK